MAAVELWNTSLWNDANLVGYYRLEDTTDNKPIPSFNLTNNNSVAFNPALFGNGADFGATNSTKYLSISNNLGITGTNNPPATIMLWSKMNTEIGTTYQVFSELQDATGHWMFQIYYEYNGGTRRITFNRQLVGDTNHTISSNITMGTTTFHHFALTYNGANMIGYVDGSPFGTLNTTGTGPSGSSFFQIGFGDANYASAIIDDEAVFSRALSATEISNYYNGLLGPATGHGGFMTTNSKYWGV